jgi:hypothetical protein
VGAGEMGGEAMRACGELVRSRRVEGRWNVSDVGEICRGRESKRRWKGVG